MGKRKWMVAAMAACAVAVVALAGCGSNDAQSGADQTASSTDQATSAIVAATAEDTSAAAAPTGEQFIVGFDQEYPPYGYVGEDGEFTGFDLELAQEVCKRNGWEYVPNPINWDTKLTELNAGVFSCIWNGFTMEGREDDYAFTEPYMDNGQVVLVKADSDIQTLDDLAGKVVATQVDSAGYEVLTEGDRADLGQTFAALEERDTYEIAAKELEAGAFDALACDLSIASYNMAKNPGAYRMLDEYLSQEHYAVGFKKGNEAQAAQVTETLREMAADGTVEALCEKYADDGISFDNWILK